MHEGGLGFLLPVSEKKKKKTIKMPHNEGAQSRFHSDEGAPDARMLLTC